MNLASKRELEVTRAKLRDIEQLYATAREKSDAKTYAGELTLRSLKRTIKQLKEDIARFEAKTRYSSSTE
jgi:hypothetical protein